MKTFEEYTQLNESPAPTSWLADMEAIWPTHYKRLSNKVNDLAKLALDKDQYKDYQQAVKEFSSATSTFQYLFDIMADYNKGAK